ncbi:MAG: hypothetical protein M3Y60_05930, partial [Bacteroidota bacterium]|nr:hypothetical protein [Bacteroidota bacterium]
PYEINFQEVAAWAVREARAAGSGQRGAGSEEKLPESFWDICFECHRCARCREVHESRFEINFQEVAALEAGRQGSTPTCF